MGDSSTFGDVPDRFDIVGAYINGHYGVATMERLNERYPNRGHVLFDVLGDSPDAHIRDWENGDKGGSLEQWVIDHNKITKVNDAVVYCDRSTVPEVRRLTGSQILGEDYYLFISTLDGTEIVGPGIVACQHKGQKLTGGHWDESVVYDDRFWKAIEPHRPGRPDCTLFQKAVRTNPDNLWGKNTDMNADAVRSAGSSMFPYGVIFAQKAVGAWQDGIWGSESKLATKGTIVDVQRALASMGFDPKGIDGIWGNNTQTAYVLARNACHI
jgi:hypothetical protein